MGQSIFDMFLKYIKQLVRGCLRAAGLLLEAISVLTPWLRFTQPAVPKLLHLCCLYGWSCEQTKAALSVFLCLRGELTLASYCDRLEPVLLRGSWAKTLKQPFL